MLIPPQSLAPELLKAVLEEFITREGTDYGAVEIELEAKLSQLKRQVMKEEVLLVFVEASETVNLITKQDYEAGI
ncbi:YheU family protein [Agaribacterium sp. ZY112]|uniref:YheU family protein n=1 Tax=Agaribacterium sp. ZY112 TaxID=3233574 RepID=UPI003526C1CD